LSASRHASPFAARAFALPRPYAGADGARNRAIKDRISVNICLGHYSIARVIRMKVIAAIIGGQELRWVVRVARGCVEIDHPVEFMAGTYPMVDLLPYKVAVRRIISSILEGRERRAINLQALRVSAPDQLAVTSDDSSSINVADGQDLPAGVSLGDFDGQIFQRFTAAHLQPDG
jgi:hypothetical protein